ncbi:MAG TPA: hypothetical protein VMV86_04530 [Methanosarcinales archaeon]|nr:hypothetical protein [Methanosarcinales archaeon]
MIKQACVFISLKLGELAAIVFAPYFVGCWDFAGVSTVAKIEQTVFSTWLVGFINLCVGVGACFAFALLCCVCYLGVKANWHLAKKIVNKPLI